jgi:alpha,alpha-trehalase
MSTKLREFIKISWDKALTYNEAKSFDLPHPFVPPCVDGRFRTLYYWDTYFTNVGLILDGKKEYALYNTEDLIFALNFFGCVPNCVWDGGADVCSQPPLLGLMIKDIYKAYGDEKWLDNALAHLEKEYEFWMTKRITPIGLNQYGHNNPPKELILESYKYISTHRLPHLPKDADEEYKINLVLNLYAEGESGEDYTPRYDHHNPLDYSPIDLNSHLYGVEDFLATAYKTRDSKKSEYYENQKNKRLELLNKYCFDEKTKLYYDYDFVKKERSTRICCACFTPFFYGYAKDISALPFLYDALKCKGGLVACEDVGDCSYQWGYPFVWAPHQFFAHEALYNNGYKDIAKELRTNYMNLLSSEFDKSGRLWERYDENGVAPGLEYATVPMLGWTAGVYTHFYYLSKKEN